MIAIRNVLAVVLGISLFTAPALADSVTNIAVADTSLFENAPNNNLGRSSLVAGAIAESGGGARARALIKFDVSNLPAGAIVTNARVVIRSIRAPSGAASSTFALRRVMRGWGEGTKGSSGVTQGTTAGAGEASWNNRFTGQAGGGWSAAGGGSPLDFLGTASATAVVAGLGSHTFASTAALVADVQSWKAEPALNFGWVLVSESEGTKRTARRFGSREGAPVAAPQLIIDYVVPAVVADVRVDSITTSGSLATLRFAVPMGMSYGVQRNSTFSPDAWETFTNITAKFAPVQGVITDDATAPVRFYRLVASPVD